MSLLFIGNKGQIGYEDGRIREKGEKEPVASDGDIQSSLV